MAKRLILCWFNSEPLYATLSLYAGTDIRIIVKPLDITPIKYVGCSCKLLAKEAGLARLCEISGIWQASEVFVGLPVAHEAVLDRIVTEVCILTGVQYQDALEMPLGVMHERSLASDDRMDMDKDYGRGQGLTVHATSLHALSCQHFAATSLPSCETVHGVLHQMSCLNACQV